MPIEIVISLILVFSIFGVAFILSAGTRLFGGISFIVVGALSQWTNMACQESDKIKEELVDVLQVYELKNKEKTVHVIYHEDKVIILEKELQQEIKSKEISIHNKPSNFACGMYFTPETKYVQK